MWAVSSIPSQAYWPPPTTTKSPRPHGPVTVSAKPRRQSPSLIKNYNHFDDDEDELAQSVNTPISKNPKSEEEIDSDVRSQEEGNKYNDSDGEEKLLGGSDILWALQKASAQKPKVKQKKREMKDAEKRNEEERDCSKPLCIRSDWSKRLDDLERRLGELTHS